MAQTHHQNRIKMSSITKEKIEMLDEAIAWHSAQEDVSDTEIEWIEWARKRVKELERGES
jgi:maleate cis-trans isomerase